MRTTVSAIAGLYYLNDKRKHVATLGIVGTGFIAKNLIDSFARLNWEIGEILLFDLDAGYAQSMREHAQATLGCPVTIVDQLDTLLSQSQVIATMTTAGTPYISARALLAHNPIILNISLRDFSADLILDANNIVDDIDHCLKANTSPHLAYQQSGNKDFINGHFGDLISGKIVLDTTKPVIFSPFGLGVLDVALGKFVYDELCKTGKMSQFPEFFGEQARW